MKITRRQLRRIIREIAANDEFGRMLGFTPPLRDRMLPSQPSHYCDEEASPVNGRWVCGKCGEDLGKFDPRDDVGVMDLGYSDQEEL